MRANELRELVAASSPLMRALGAVRASMLPDAWIGGGVLRDLVWGLRYGDGFIFQAVRDVDVAFFDPADLSRENDQRATARLRRICPDVPWEATWTTSTTIGRIRAAAAPTQP